MMEIIYFIMAISLQNSLFIHFPKTGGKWVSKMLINHVEGSSFVGDPIYDAHKCPKWDKTVFFFVRKPDTWLRSLWHHRARKKSNKFGQPFNWQTKHRLEKNCQSRIYETFVDNVIKNPNCLNDYYNDFICMYEQSQLLWGHYENLCEDLIKILKINNEKFNEQAIRKNKNTLINKHNSNRNQYATNNINALNKSESKFLQKYYDINIS